MNKPQVFRFVSPSPRLDTGSGAPSPQSGLPIYVKIFLDCSFFFGCCPFRLRLVQSSPQPTYIGSSWLPQKLLCLILVGLHILWMIRDVKTSLPGPSKNPSAYFRMVHSLSSLVWKLSLHEFFWCNKSDFVRLANFLADPRTSIPVPRRIFVGVVLNSPRRLVYFIAVLFSGLGLFDWGTGKAGGHILDWTFERWWSAYKATVKPLFFIDPGSSIDKSGWGTILAVLSAAGSLQKHIIIAYCYFLWFALVLTLRSAIWAFNESFEGALHPGLGIGWGGTVETSIFAINKNYGKPFWPEIRRKYMALKLLSELINKPFGSNLTYFLLQIIVFYAVTFNLIFNEAKPDWGLILLLTVYFANAATLLIYCANICSDMNKLKSWLSIESNQQQLSGKELSLTVNEVDSHVISIKASNVFPITHSLLANILGVTVTYFIICVQV